MVDYQRFQVKGVGAVLLKRTVDGEVVSLSQYPAHVVEIAFADGRRLRFPEHEIDEIVLAVETVRSGLFGEVAQT